MNDTILFGRGDQTIRFVPVDPTGTPRRVTTATLSIVDLRDPIGSSSHEVLASTAAVASAVAATLTAASGPSTADPRRLTVDDTTGYRTNSVHLLEDLGSGRQESFRVSVVDASALELTATNDFYRNYDSASTIVALELEGSFPGTVADDEQRLDNGGGPFLVVWVYTIAAQLYVHTEEKWITRYGVQPWVTADQVFQTLPGLAQQGGESVTPEQAIAAATDDLFEHLQGSAHWKRDPAYFRGNISADLAVRKWAVMYMLRGQRNDPALDLADRYEIKGLQHAQNLTEGKPTNRSVAIDPINETARPGGERASVGGQWGRG